jgi:hypothetical protein
MLPPLKKSKDCDEILVVLEAWHGGDADETSVADAA